jgi:RNA recognition motif-containing protein
MAKRLFVGNLPFTATEADLRELFAQAGTVEAVNVIINRDTGQSKGFAFVEMATEDEAKKAIQSLDGYKINDRPIVVNEARPKEENH